MTISVDKKVSAVMLKRAMKAMRAIKCYQLVGNREKRSGDRKLGEISANFP